MIRSFVQPSKRGHIGGQPKVSQGLLIWLVLFICCNRADTPLVEQDPYRFFIAGHVSGNPANWHQGFHAPFKEKSFLISQDSSIAFGVLLGDMVKKGSASNFTVLDEDIGSLERSTYMVAGNHDVTDRTLYDQWYGPSYYSFVQNGDLFIVLDSNLDGWNIVEDQLQFLISAMDTKTPVRNIFVFVHHLLWWAPDNRFNKVRINSSTGRAAVVNFYDEILPLLRSQGVPIFLFAGDVGAQATGSEFMYYREDAITFIASGMGGGERDNFVVIKVDRNGGVHFDLIALNGDDIHALGKLQDYQLPE